MARRSVIIEEEETQIDLSPMIDCIFILLIFFIVTTVFVEEKGLQVEKPDAAAAASVEDSENLTIQITAEDEVLWNGEKIALGELPGRVKASIDGPETPITLRAHEKSHHGTFVAVWDAAKRGGAGTLSFTTIN